MRKALRAISLLFFAYLLQTTALPSVKIGGILLDLVTITLFSVGFSQGTYMGITGGLLMALIMESLTGELGGFTAVMCVLSGGLGVFIESRVRSYQRPGKRGRELLVKWLLPAVSIGLLVIFREAVYAAYFYLVGVELGFMHIFRALLAGFVVSSFSFVLLPLFAGYLTRSRENTYLHKRLEKWRKRGKPKPVVPENPPTQVDPLEGGIDEQ